MISWNLSAPPEFSGELLERFPVPLDRRRKIVLLQIRPCDKHVSGVIEGVGVDVECLELADTWANSGAADAVIPWLPEVGDCRLR